MLQSLPQTGERAEIGGDIARPYNSAKKLEDTAGTAEQVGTTTEFTFDVEALEKEVRLQDGHKPKRQTK